MTDEHRHENEACEAVVMEFRAMLVQQGVAEPIVKLCDELAGRIKLRRLLNVDTTGEMLRRPRGGLGE